MATAKIQSGMAHCIIAGGAESMSLFQWEATNQLRLCCRKSWKRGLLLGMGLTSEVKQQLTSRV
jgi:acetyl-CoA acyltransferase